MREKKKYVKVGEELGFFSLFFPTNNYLSDIQQRKSVITFFHGCNPSRSSKFKPQFPVGIQKEKNLLLCYGALMCCKKDTPVDKKKAIVWRVTDGEKGGFKLSPQSKNK